MLTEHGAMTSLHKFRNVCLERYRVFLIVSWVLGIWNNNDLVNAHRAATVLESRASEADTPSRWPETYSLYPVVYISLHGHMDGGMAISKIKN